jgi:predicted transposase/invertase (TIGR01784 family)
MIGGESMVWMVKEDQDSLAFELLDTRNDFVFKSIFGVEKNKDLLTHFLMAILEIDIKEIVFVDPHLEMNHADDKASILDIRVLSNDNSMINIEIQLQNHHAFPERMLMYWAKMYANQDRKRQPYSKLNKTIQIAVTDFNFLPKEHFHSKFLLTETEDQFVYSHHLEMHVLELTKIDMTHIKEATALEKWLLFIKGDQKVKEGLAMEEPTFSKAYQALQDLSQDQLARYHAMSSERTERTRIQIEEDARVAVEESLRKGIEEGREIGKEIGINEGKKIGKEECKKIGKEEGKKIGKEEGINLERKNNIQKMAAAGMTIEQIASILEIPKLEVEKFANK